MVSIDTLSEFKRLKGQFNKKNEELDSLLLQEQNHVKQMEKPRVSKIVGEMMLLMSEMKSIVSIKN